MFTSRAENRLHIRGDNAYQRLSPDAESLGLLDDDMKKSIKIRNEAFGTFESKIEEFVKIIDIDEQSRDKLKLGEDINKKISIKDLIQKHRATKNDLREILEGAFLDDFLTDLFYAPYIEKE